MIGQKELLTNIDNIQDRFPRFSIIVGPKGSGKKTISRHIVNKLKLKPITIGTKIEEIRKAIDMAYTQVEPIAFLIPNSDKMSLGAKNSLLKVTEEPPRNCYFIMTLENLANTLGTIQSRGTVFRLDPYTNEELLQYCRIQGYSNKYDNIVSLVCSNTGEVNELFSYDVEDFYKFSKCIVDNIQVPKSGNAFKITTKAKIKENATEGYDTSLLLKAVQRLFLEKGKTTKDHRYLDASITTGKWLQKLQLATVNKLSVLDMWIIEVRKDLRGL